jgi:hypothetical protein
LIIKEKSVESFFEIPACASLPVGRVGRDVIRERKIGFQNFNKKT